MSLIPGSAAAFCSALVIAFCCVPASADPERLTAPQILANSENALPQKCNFSSKDELWLNTTAGWIKGGTDWEYIIGKFDNEANGRWAWREERWTKLPTKETTLDPEAKLTNVKIWLAAQLTLYGFSSYPQNNPKFPFKAPGGISVQQQTAAEAEPYRRSGCASAFDGYLGGDPQPLVSLLRKSAVQVQEKMEPINGSQCYVIRSTNSYGKFCVWIDPEHGFNLARAEIRKDGHDIYGGGPLPRPGLTGGGAFVAFSQAFEVTHFEKVDDHWIGTEGKGESETEFAGGTITQTSSVDHRTAATFKPDFTISKPFDLVFPNGSMFFGPGAVPGVRRVWQDGKIVLQVNPATTQTIDKEIEAMRNQGANTSALPK